MGHVGFEENKGLRHDDDICGAQFRFDLKDRIVVLSAHQALQFVLQRVVILLHRSENFATVLFQQIVGLRIPVHFCSFLIGFNHGLVLIDLTVYEQGTLRNLLVNKFRVFFLGSDLNGFSDNAINRDSIS